MTTTEQPRNAVIYCRISSDREGREYGVDRQEAHCRRLADRRGWHVVAVLVDNDITGTGSKKRPGYDRLLTMLREGTADAVLAVSDKRLNRNYRNAFALLDLIQERDISVEFTKGGAINMNTAEGRGIARRKAIDAQEESEEIGERVADAKRDNVRDGTYRGGGRPFGYEADGTTPRSLVCPDCGATGCFTLTVTRTEDAVTAVRVACSNGCTAEPGLAEGSEAWHLREATHRIIKGETVRSVLRAWQAAGVRTPPRRKRLPDGTRTEPTPADWTPTTLRNLLLRPRNAGLLEVTERDAQGKILKNADGRKISTTTPAAWPALVTRAEWDTCRSVLENADRRTTPGPARKWLGSGLFLCGKDGCGHAARSTGRGNGNGSVYTCGANGVLNRHVVRGAAAVDDHVERTIIAELVYEATHNPFWPPAPETPDGRPADALAARVAALRAQREALAEQFGDDEADLALYRVRARRITEEIKTVEQQIAEAVRSSAARGPGPLHRIDLPELVKRHRADPEDALAWWRSAYPLEQRREFLAALAVVTIYPGSSGRPPGWVPGTPYFDPKSVDVDWTGAA